jgi:hypothetical protein
MEDLICHVGTLIRGGLGARSNFNTHFPLNEIDGQSAIIRARL